MAFTKKKPPFKPGGRFQPKKKTKKAPPKQFKPAAPGRSY